jgi:small subunit ribosomal protein S14
MAKLSVVERNKKRKNMSDRAYLKRKAIKDRIYDKNINLEERFLLVMKLASLPRNSAGTRVRNRCGLTGRSRGYIDKFGLSRNMVRHFASQGKMPGVIKASW